MRRSILVLLGLCLLLAAGAPPAGAKAVGSLDMYEANVSAAKASQLLKKGYDVTNIAYRRGGATIDIVLTRAQRDRLRADGVKLTLKRTRSGKTVRQAAAAQAAGGFTVYRSWDSPGGSATSSTAWRVTTATWSS